MKNVYGAESHWNMGVEIFAGWLLVGCIGFLVFLLFYLTVIRVPAKPILEEFWARFRFPTSWEKQIICLYKSASDQITRWYMQAKERIYRIPQLAKFLPAQGIELVPMKEAEVSVVRKAVGPDEIANSAAVIGAPLSDEDEDHDKDHDKQQTLNFN